MAHNTIEDNKRCVAMLTDLWERDLITIQRVSEVGGLEGDDEDEVVYGFRDFDHPEVVAAFSGPSLQSIVRVPASDIFAAIRR